MMLKQETHYKTIVFKNVYVNFYSIVLWFYIYLVEYMLKYSTGKMIFKEINTFIDQGRIQLMTVKHLPAISVSDKCCSFEVSINQESWNQMYPGFFKHIKQCNCW